MSGTHPSEIARLEIAAHWDYGRVQSLVAPGSFEEESALEDIDRLRLEERARLGDTFAARRLRARRHFRTRGSI